MGLDFSGKKINIRVRSRGQPMQLPSLSLKKFSNRTLLIVTGPLGCTHAVRPRDMAAKAK